MRQALDVIMQIITLVLGCWCLVYATFEDNTFEYLAMAMALVSASLLFSRIQDKEERK